MATEERTEQATPRRRQKAREEGQVAQSKDLTGAIGLIAAVLVYRLAGHSIAQRLITASAHHFANLQDVSVTFASVRGLAHDSLMLIAGALMPVALAALAFGLTANFIQTGFVLSTKRITPTADKLNPINGIKKIFSLNGIVEALKGTVKVAVVIWLAYVILNGHKAEVLKFSQMDLRDMLGHMSAIFFEFATKYCLALLIIGGLDYTYQRWQLEKQLRMTRYEVKRELRETEGDPLVRARRSQRRRALLQQGISNQMPQANVVVTNPTQVAVALLYKDGRMPAPQVVAKGRGRLAGEIKKLAVTYGIPIVEEPPVARALYEVVGIGEYVPSVLYQAVAEILAAVYRAAQERRARRRAQMQQQRQTGDFGGDVGS